MRRSIRHRQLKHATDSRPEPHVHRSTTIALDVRYDSRQERDNIYIRNVHYCPHLPIGLFTRISKSQLQSQQGFYLLGIRASKACYAQGHGKDRNNDKENVSCIAFASRLFPRDPASVLYIEPKHLG